MRRLLVLALAIAFSACGDDTSSTTPDAGEDMPDAPPDAPPGNTEVTCEMLPPVSSGTCSVTAGGPAKLLKGEILTPSKLFHGGQVAIDASGAITCVGCNCAQGGETVISCPDAAISPGLINTHDHTQFANSSPYGSPLYTNNVNVRYEDRMQWREGVDGKPRIRKSGTAGADHIRVGELRFVMGGTTSIVGEGSVDGLLRNLDKTGAQQHGLNKKAVEFDTFPLDDFSSMIRRTGDCNYGGSPTTAASIATKDAYEPHTSEGIDSYAHNEFLCESSATYDTMTPGTSNNLMIAKTAMIHAVGLKSADYGAMAAAGTALIWSPRSNITLYGDTARVSTADRVGVQIALGTDWMPTGSMNLNRELACADSFNKTYLDNHFSDVDLWSMVTVNAAEVTATGDVIGQLAPGKLADISIFKRNGKPGYRAVIESEPKDVVLVMRAGKILYGDADAVTGTTTDACDTVDVCGVAKKVCLMGEIGKTYAALQTAVGATNYPVFACGQPANEPSCTPTRPTAVMSSTVYTGAPSATDKDGDGIADAADKCPAVFSPVRPMDGGNQADADNDSLGDECDPCPFDANSTTCSVVDPNDRDHDGVPNATDNCPDLANMSQTDSDMDGKGDACDVCPMASNPGAAGCPASIYSIKNGTVPVGSAVRVVNALVTGKGSNGFFVQTKMGDAGYMGVDYSGLFVYTGSMSPLLANATIGARVSIDGSLANFQGQLQLVMVSAVTVTAVGPEALPAPVSVTYAEVKTGGTRAQTLESVIVTLGPAAVSARDTMLGEFTLTSGADSLVVDDFLFATTPLPQVGQMYASARGVLNLRNMVSKLEPVAAADLVLGAPGLASLGPAGSFARVGAPANAPTFPQPLTVTLTGPAQGDTTVMIVSGTPGSLTVSNVTVPNGMTSAPVNVTAVAQDANVPVMAMLGVQTLTSNVRVLGAAEAPSMVTLTPAANAIAAGGTVQFTVTLDVPALVATQVDLAVNPATAGTLPANVMVQPNQSTATFTYTDTMAPATATVTATLGVSTSNATVTISTGANHLVINEVDYDQTVNPDSAEFIEIYNPSPVPVSLANLQIILINGNGNTSYATINLGTGMLAGGGYIVIAGANVTVPAGVTKIDPGWTTDEVQNGAPDGIALIDNAAHTLIDALSYEGSMTMVDLPGFATASSLVEGTATTAADSGAGALCRSPNGQDTDNAMADWKLCASPSAGQPNP